MYSCEKEGCLGNGNSSEKVCCEKVALVKI